MNTPGERLKLLRKQLDLTQKEIGKRIGLGWYQIKDLEAGKVKISPLIAKILYHEFHANPDWLLTGEGPMYREEKQPEIGEIDDTSRKILLLLKDMDEDKRREFLRSIEKEKLLQELLEERRKKEAG